ncbi:MAG: AAA family ATPase [Acidimicrobiales bacterium]
MGHGLQMWLQVMWFLAHNSDTPTIVLDEPDVYMHADLQRKLVRLLKGSGQQIMIATHSVEIMAEVDPSEVLIIDSDRARSNWAANIKGVQRVVDTIGGVHNLQLSRLATARRCLFVEGKDVAILTLIIHDTHRGRRLRPIPA